MTKRQDDDRQRQEIPDSEDGLEALLGMADPRPAPPAAEAAEIRAAVHAEWQKLTGRRQLRRRAMTYGLAASALIALFAGLSMLRAPGDDARGEQVAAIEKHRGVLRVSGGDDVVSAVPESILSGQIIETGANSGVALAWQRGGSLRLDANTRVQFESVSRIRLVAGRVYYDSVSDPMTRVAPQAGMARILVETPYGTLRHVGTQFVAGLTADEELRVLVREGAVRLDLDGDPRTAAAAQQVQVTRDRRVLTSAITGSGSEWRWVEQLSPPVDLEGRSVYEALQWVSRETGQAITYRGSAERIARRNALRGVDRLGESAPSSAMSAIVSMGGLEWRGENGEIIVIEPGDNGASPAMRTTIE